MLTVCAATSASAEVVTSGHLAATWAADREQTQLLELELVGRIEGPAGHCRWIGEARARADSADRYEPGQPRDRAERSALSQRLLWGDDVDVELRELVLDCDVGSSRLSIGKQQTVWGQADGLKVLDVVNPQSLRNFITDDFGDSRIGLWSLNAEIPLGRNAQLQLLWLPDSTVHDLPQDDSHDSDGGAHRSPAIFGQRAGVAIARSLIESSGLLPAELPLRVNLAEASRPEAGSGFAARLQMFLGGWDIGLHALDHLDPAPVLAGRLTIDGTSAPQEALLTLTPIAYRRSLYGISFSNSFGPVTLRGEAAWTPDRRFSTLDPADDDGLVESSELSTVIGLDFSGPAGSLISFQLFRSDLDEPLSPSDLGLPVVRDESESTATALYLQPLGADRHELRALWVHGLERDDGWAQLRLTLSVTESLDVLMGGDVFYGDALGLFGQFDRRDHFRLGLQWHW